MKLIYIDDYKMDEETTLNSLGIDSYRLRKDVALSQNGFVGIDKNDTYLMRGPRLTIAEYREFWEVAAMSGIVLISKPRSFEIGANFAEQYQLFREMSPGALIVDAAKPDKEIFDALIKRGLQFPLFIRSEIESAAKYVGIDGCIAKNPTLNEIAFAIANLRKHVKGFTSLIFKEVVEIGLDPNSKKRLEYRAIGVNGRLITFDYDKEKDNLPEPEEFGLNIFANEVLTALANGGADGGLFVDVAVTASQEPIVVECKNLLNGTIASVGRFGEALLREAR